MAEPGQRSTTETGERIGSLPMIVIPSWLASVVLHATLMLTFASGLRSCQNGPTGQGEGKLREVGIYVKQPGEAAESVESQAESEESASEISQRAAQESVVEDAPPVELPSPGLEGPAVLGPGPSAPAPAAGVPDVDGFLRPNGARRPKRPGALAKGETTFFGARDKGTHFVYLLDSSGSMAGSPIRVAKAELMKSIEALEPTQRFQIIFYNQTPRKVTLRGTDEKALYWASSINKTLARQGISGIRTGGGTEHMPALKLALRLDPEVLFFLTDADEPRLTAGQLEEIERRNGGRTRIHCIEFGTGPNLVDTFLKRLAEQNGGSYRYRDVTEFDRR